MKTSMRYFMALVLMALMAGTLSAQSYRVENNTVVKVAAAKGDTIKTPDKVFAVVDGKTFYQGPRGGVYYWKTKADGTRAKVYVKKTTAAK